MRTTPSDAPLAQLSAVPRWARVTAVTVAALALTACSAGSSSSGGSSSEAMGAVAPAPAAGGAADGSTTGKAAVTGTNVLGSALTGSDRSIVVRAQSTVRVEDVPASTAKLGTIAAGHRATIATQATSDGITPVPTDPQPADSSGTIAGSSACGSTGCTKGYASSVTTLRLDNDAVDGLLHDVAGLGTVEATSRTSDDVTAEVADVAARVSNARASLARVRALMSRATNVAEVVALEGELSKREGDLEAVEARQRTLADQSAQATVTITLLSKEAPVAAAADETGFLAGLKQGWSAFTTAMVAGLTVVGALVPFLILLVPVALVLWFLRRRRSAARLAATVEGPPATA